MNMNELTLGTYTVWYMYSKVDLQLGSGIVEFMYNQVDSYILIDVQFNKCTVSYNL